MTIWAVVIPDPVLPELAKDGLREVEAGTLAWSPAMEVFSDHPFPGRRDDALAPYRLAFRQIASASSVRREARAPSRQLSYWFDPEPWRPCTVESEADEKGVTLHVVLVSASNPSFVLSWRPTQRSVLQAPQAVRGRRGMAPQ